MFNYEIIDGVSHIHTSYKDLAISSDPSKGFRPVELLVSSIVGCSAGIFYKVLAKKRIAVENIKVEVNIVRNSEEANRITNINLHFILVGKKLSNEQIQKSLAVTFKNCSMIQSVKDSIEIKESFDIINI